MNHPARFRGLTLVETLAATVLLAILAATSLPLVVESVESIAQPLDAAACEALVSDLKALAVASQAAKEGRAEISAGSPTGDLENVRVMRIEKTRRAAAHRWIIASRDGWCAARWTPDASEASAAPASGRPASPPSRQDSAVDAGRRSGARDER